MAKVWIGTSGWVYRHWMAPVGNFYPEKMPGEQQLPFYAQHFPTVEINYSYYHLPPRSSFESWQERSPEGFLFAAKASAPTEDYRTLSVCRELPVVAGAPALAGAA